MKQNAARKLLSFMLTLALALALGLLSGMSLTALAAGTASDPISIDSWDGLKNALSGDAPSGESLTNPTYYRLDGDVKDESPTEATYINVASGRHVVLDLNGKKINRNLTSAIDNGCVIKVQGDLTIKDSNGGGTITGGYSSGDGGGVYIFNGKFTMEGGTITKNIGNDGGGAGVFVDRGGTFTMEGGTISQNSVGFGTGGGVYVDSNGMFNMTGGAIRDNKATGTDGGGGVYVSSDGTFNMKKA